MDTMLTIDEGDISSTGTLSRLRLLYTRVRLRRSYRSLCSLVSPELHGNEDGTIPATFQIIYVVSAAYFEPWVLLSPSLSDWMEACTKPTEAS